MLNRLLVLALMAVVTLFALTLVQGDGPGSGHVVWAPMATRGVNSGDVPIFAAWAVAMVAGVVLLVRRG